MGSITTLSCCPSVKSTRGVGFSEVLLVFLLQGLKGKECTDGFKQFVANSPPPQQHIPTWSLTGVPTGPAGSPLPVWSQFAKEGVVWLPRLSFLFCLPFHLAWGGSNHLAGLTLREAKCFSNLAIILPNCHQSLGTMNCLLFFFKHVPLS